MSKKNKQVNTRKWHSSVGYKIFIILVMLFIYAPIFSLILFSFNAEKSATRWGGFSLTHYESLFENQAIMDSLSTTITIALLATVISTFLGTLGAIGVSYISKQKRSFADLVMNINNLPVVNPEIVTAVSLMVVFTSMRFELGYFTMLLAHISFCTPYVVITVYPKVCSLDPALMEAAQDLGASPTKSLVKVMIPELLPAIIGGATMAFTMSFDDFVISYFVGGTEQNISMYLYSMKKFDPAVNALSTILIFVIAFVVLGAQIFKSRKKNLEEEENKQSKNKNQNNKLKEVSL